MAKKDKYFHLTEIEIPLYRGFFIIIVTNDKVALNKKVSNFSRDRDLYAHSWVMKHKKKQGFTVVFNFDHNISRITHGTITHEVMHTTLNIAEYRGFDSDFVNTESLCYLSDWLGTEVYKYIKELGFEIHIEQFKK